MRFKHPVLFHMSASSFYVGLPAPFKLKQTWFFSQKMLKVIFVMSENLILYLPWCHHGKYNVVVTKCNLNIGVI